MKNQLFILLTVIASITYALSDLFLKLSNTSDMIDFILNSDSDGVILLIYFILGLGLTFLSKVISAVILARYPLGLTQAIIISMIIVFNLFIGITILEETLGFQELFGIFLIIGGIVILNVKTENDSIVEIDKENQL